MKKVFIVPHTHWDREWYFTYDTSNVLLNHNIKEMVEKTDFKQKMFFDGQWSLINDYLLFNPSDRKKIFNLLEKKVISSGPLYTQPDVYNSLAETIFRNFEIGNNFASGMGIKNSDVAYLPDTFGFSENIPQIFRKNKIINFVFWRGAPKKLVDKHVKFKWVGIDGSELNSYCLKDGYYSLGMYYPYNGKNDVEKYSAINFLKKIEKRIMNLKDNDEILILPLGGDQAPFLSGQVDFINKVNNLTNNYSFSLHHNYDKFFKKISYDDKIKYKGSLRIPYTGKIHRTIGSSRYDIKRKFRNAEQKLYYLLEPLEVLYKQIDSDYDFESYKEENIFKPLLLAQAHDSLGGCNTDITNKYQMHRLERIEQNIFSIVDLILKKIAYHKKLEEDNLVIYNPAPFVNTLFETKIIYSKENRVINYKNDKLIIMTLNSKNISYSEEKKLFEQRVIIIANDLLPNELLVKDISKSNYEFNNTINVNNIISLNKEKIEIRIKNHIFGLKFNFIEDAGDSYDFSPGKSLKYKQVHKIENINNIDKNYMTLTILSTIYNQNNKKINKFKSLFLINMKNNKIDLELETLNELKNCKVALNIFDYSSKKNILKSQNLIISKFEENAETKEKDWKNKYKEFVAPVDINDGLIILNNLSIATNGNNEFYKSDDGVLVTLYRAYNFVTNKNMEWRKTTSGLSWKEDSPDSQLNKKLNFRFSFKINDDISNMLENKFIPYSYKIQTRNFIANKMNKFVINNMNCLKSKKTNIEVLSKDAIISMYRLKNNRIELRVSNPKNKKINFMYMVNGIQKNKKINNYKIENIFIDIKERND